MHDNRVFTADGKATEAGKSIAQWQAQGHDLGTKSHTKSYSVYHVQCSEIRT
jgi:hypothetical protein